MTRDRSILLQPGELVQTGYVAVDRIRLACRERMAVGDVNAAYQRLLQQAPAQEWPPPVGRWDGEQFELLDGRHAFVAYLMLGFSHIIVAWKAPARGQGTA